jgi:putative ABC transport system permease protein
MQHYLQDFKYRVHPGAGVFAVTIVSTFIIAALTVGYRCIKSALANPVNSLRSQ